MGLTEHSSESGRDPTNRCSCPLRRGVELSVPAPLNWGYVASGGGATELYVRVFWIWLFQNERQSHYPE